MIPPGLHFWNPPEAPSIDTVKTISGASKENWRFGSFLHLVSDDLTGGKDLEMGSSASLGLGGLVEFGQDGVAADGPGVC
mmetsp:Transcript_16056/g.33216  ORF Transcript_16056/g.33216 Transcript_16056/m.33216 type:complete len:80 (-) Transcript_16056:481-720(-)